MLETPGALIITIISWAFTIGSYFIISKMYFNTAGIIIGAALAVFPYYLILTLNWDVYFWFILIIALIVPVAPIFKKELKVNYNLSSLKYLFAVSVIGISYTAGYWFIIMLN